MKLRPVSHSRRASLHTFHVSFVFVISFLLSWNCARRAVFYALSHLHTRSPVGMRIINLYTLPCTQPPAAAAKLAFFSDVYDSVNTERGAGGVVVVW